MKEKKIIIAVDGHSSCGKSTLAKAIADYFSYTYIDTGAMYRAVTLYALNENIINVENKNIDLNKLRYSIDNQMINIDFVFNPEKNKAGTYLNNIYVENEIRGIKVSSFVSPIAVIDFVRENLVNQQKKMGEKGGIVMDGRDIATVVFPNAELKIFLTARVDVRAQRRFIELTEKGIQADFETIKKNIEERDFIDSNRETAPLRQAPDAILIDNSDISREEQTKLAVDLVKKILMRK